MDDPIAMALESSRVSAWVARCRTAAEPPPLAMPYVKLDPREHQAAIDAALVRGTSCLTEYRNMPKAKIQTVPPEQPRRTPCVGCGLNLTRAHPNHAFCTACASDLAGVRAKLESMRASARARADAAVAEAQAARDALSDKDAAKWNKIAAARLAVSRVGRHAGTETAEQAAWWARVKAALDNARDTRVSDALRRVYVADEIAFWAMAGAAAEERRIAVAIAQIEEYQDEDLPF